MNGPELNCRTRWLRLSGGSLSGAVVLLLVLFTALTDAQVADLSVYEDGLSTGWQDWSWSDTTLVRNLNNTVPVHSGTRSIAVTYTGGWSALQLGYGGAFLDISAYDTLQFWVHGGASGGQSIEVQVNDGSPAIAQVIHPAAGAWMQVDISLLDLGAPRRVYSLAWFNNSAGAQPIFYLDRIAFVDSGATPVTPTPHAGPALVVDVAASRHPISRDIYGMNFADEALAAELNLPVRRWGGNHTTRYNWQNDTSNKGSDWYFENIPESNADPALLPDGSATDLFIEQDRRTGTQTLLTVPIIGWAAKQRPAGHPYDCGFKVGKYGTQQSVDPWDEDCGNGVRTDGATLITGTDPLDTSVVITPTFISGWIAHLTAKYGLSTSGGVKFYALDNEPMLWNYTHRDVHPDPVDYDEIRDRAYAYGAAIKAVDPGALTLGPVVWGWCAYFHSASDGCAPGADYAAHGNKPFIPWYLEQMQIYEQQHGMRILDYLDLHVYPQAPGIFSDQQGSTSTRALRLRSTRQLWDTTYVDESWIGQPVNLIPRMRAWVDNDYPDTKLAITEYNWGAQGYMNGALAQADVLGIFGREGLDLATLWGPPQTDQPGAYAFRMYLNYDGQGSAFGQTSVHALSGNQDQLAIYAAQRGDGALTLMIINKTGAPLTSTVSISNFDAGLAARVYRYSASRLDAIVHEPDQLVGAGGFTAAFPPESITLIVVPPARPLDKHVYLPLATR